MLTKISIADIRLNESEKNYNKYLILENEEGTLMIHKGLYSISFESDEPIDVEVINKKHIIDVDL